MFSICGKSECVSSNCPYCVILAQPSVEATSAVPHLVASCHQATRPPTTTTSTALGPLKQTQEKPSGTKTHEFLSERWLGNGLCISHCTSVNSQAILTQLITWHGDCIAALLRDPPLAGICYFKSIIVRAGERKKWLTQAEISQLGSQKWAEHQVSQFSLKKRLRQ